MVWQWQDLPVAHAECPTSKCEHADTAMVTVPPAQSVPNVTTCPNVQCKHKCPHLPPNAPQSRQCFVGMETRVPISSSSEEKDRLDVARISPWWGESPTSQKS